MNRSDRKVIVVTIAPRTLLGRLVVTVGTIVLILLAVFFFTIFLTLFSVFVVAIIARILWAQWQSRLKVAEQAIDVEYSVEKTEAQQQGEDTLLDSGGLIDRQKPDQK